MDRYLGGEEIAEDVLVADLEQAVAQATLPPGRPGLLADRRRLHRAARPGRRGPSRRRSEHPSPEVFTPAGGEARRARLRPGRPAGRRGRQDDERPVRRPAQPGPGLLRHPRRRTRRSTCPGTSRSFFGAGVRARRTTTRTSASAPCPTPSAGTQVADRRAVVAGDLCAIGRLTRAETGDTLSSVEDPRVLQAVDDARAAAAGGDRRPLQGRRGQAVLGAVPARRRGPEHARSRTTPRPTSWCCGAWARRTPTWCSSGSAGAVRGERRPEPSSWCPLRETFAGTAKGHGRHVKQSGGHGQYAVCDIEVEPLPEGGGLRVRRQGRRRLGAPAVHPVGREGRARPDGEGGPQRLPGRRPPGDAHRRQGAHASTPPTWPSRWPARWRCARPRRPPR